MPALSPETAAFMLSVLLLIMIALVARSIHFLFFEKYFKLSYSDAPAWSFLYFSAWSTFVSFLFFAQVKALFAHVSLIEYLILALAVLVVFPALFHRTRLHAGAPAWLATLAPRQGMLTLGERYILAKIADVTFQQLIAGALILTLATAGMSYPAIVGIFVVLFAGAHLYLFQTSGFIWGLYYTTYAALGGFAFPFLILFVPGGIIYAILVHMLFYVVSGVFFAAFPRPDAAVCRELVGVTP